MECRVAERHDVCDMRDTVYMHKRGKRIQRHRDLLSVPQTSHLCIGRRFCFREAFRTEPRALSPVAVDAISHGGVPVTATSCDVNYESQGVLSMNSLGTTAGVLVHHVVRISEFVQRKHLVGKLFKEQVAKLTIFCTVLHLLISTDKCSLVHLSSDKASRQKSGHPRS